MIKGYECKHCKEIFSYPEEVMFYDAEGMELTYQEAWENGHNHCSCVECVDKYSI